MPSLTQYLIEFCVLVGVSGSVVPNVAKTHTVSHPHALPSAWYHPESHPVRALFKRDLAVPGSPQWTAQYPTAFLPPIPEVSTPQSWLNALQAAQQAGRIPNITIPTQANGQNPTYGPGDIPSGPEICSSTWQCRGAGDQWDAPDGHVGIGFDDGPSDGSAMLYQFLQAKNQSSTHFMIGVNILTNYQLFEQAYSTLQGDIAVHTWTHPYMTTMNNTQVVAQLGWTMQIIHDSTGGRVPRYWRPPYGDSDNRVRAIAKEVFGLTQIDWNNDSEDWTIAPGKTTLQNVEASLNGWYSGPKSPGLIILEHELTNNTAGAFVSTYATMQANNWTAVSTVQLFDGSYQNADDNDGSVRSMDVGGSVASTSASTPNEAPATSTPTSTSQSPSPTPGASNNKNVASNGAVRMRHGGISILITLSGAFASILW